MRGRPRGGSQSYLKHLPNSWFQLGRYSISPKYLPYGSKKTSILRNAVEKADKSHKDEAYNHIKRLGNMAVPHADPVWDQDTDIRAGWRHYWVLFLKGIEVAGKKPTGTRLKRWIRDSTKYFHLFRKIERNSKIIYSTWSQLCRNVSGD